MAKAAALDFERIDASGGGVLPAAAVLSARAWAGCGSAAEVARWDALALRASEPNPFYESWYLLPSLEALDPEGDVELLVLEQGGQWLGLLPVVRSGRYYRWPVPNLMGWVHGNAFLGAPLVARGHEEAFWRALLDHADRTAGRALFLHLAALPLEGALHDALRAVAGSRGFGVVYREERAMLRSDAGAGAYLEAALTGKKRKELRRQHARLSELGELAVVRQRDEAGLEAWIADFLTLEAAGWKGRAGSALSCDGATAALFAGSLRGAAARGRLERLMLTLNGVPAAMLATFLTAPGAFSYKTAFDERLARFSPGVLLQRENLALLDEDGIDWCDSCAAADHPMIDHLWRERRPVGRVSIAIGGAPRRAAFALLLKAELGRRPAGVVS